MSSEGLNATLAGFLDKLRALQEAGGDALAGADERTGRYAGWAYERKSLAAMLAESPGDMVGRIALIADYALLMRKDIAKLTGKWDFRTTAEQDTARRGHHNPEEGSDWVKEARSANAPLSAGPSATTAQVLALALSVKATKEELEALTWALFALWNGMPLHMSGTHRFHEVFTVAANYGVPYEKLRYPAKLPTHEAA